MMEEILMGEGGRSGSDGGTMPYRDDDKPIYPNLSDDTTPRGKAFTWLADEDERRLCPRGGGGGDDNDMSQSSSFSCSLTQRYALAVLYHSTSGDDWDSCSNAPSGGCGDDFGIMFFKVHNQLLLAFVTIEHFVVHFVDSWEHK